MTSRYIRQSFLGPDAVKLLRMAEVAIIGVGGGGSHISQQLAHVGIGHVQLHDLDRIELSNMNRLVGATSNDAARNKRKVSVAKRMMRAINPELGIEIFPSLWQASAEAVRKADVIIACVDSYSARQDIEVTARRFLIPLIDIGMDVHLVDGNPHISGQVILSTPGGPCMRCLGFLNEERLRQEANHYGAAGNHPQVIWSNGVLASVAVGILVDLFTGWTRTQRKCEYLHYDGNRHELTRSPRLEYAPTTCAHFPAEAVGEPTL